MAGGRHEDEDELESYRGRGSIITRPVLRYEDDEDEPRGRRGR